MDQQVKPCDICGDKGVIDAIITCCECQTAREHLYCMKVLRTEAPLFWCCEECEKNKSVSPTSDKKHIHEASTKKVSFSIPKDTNKNVVASRFNFKERKVNTGRTKYISCEEAVKLSSGGKKLDQPPTKVGRINPEREMKSEKSEVLPKAGSARPIEVSKSPKKLERPITKSGDEFFSIGSNNRSNIDLGSSDAGKPYRTSSVAASETHDQHIPALHSHWKGSFYLPNGHENFNDAFKAHPPSRVHNKVYETLQKMPEKLYFELVSNHEVLIEIFPGYKPDKDDIGLYFFPRFKKRYENCMSIMDFLWSKNFLMKSYVDGVELLVLSSKFLQPHCQEYQGNYFLWGVFRRRNVKKVVHGGDVADRRPLLEAKHKPFLDVPPGFEKIPKHRV